MRRDWDVVRTILLRVEDAGAKDIVDETSFEQLDVWQVAEHVRMLREAGFIQEVPRRMAGSFGIARLTWRGHDFLDALRPEGAMREIRELQEKAGGSLSSEMVREIGTAWTRASLDR